jgi:hypothetical protein
LLDCVACARNDEGTAISDQKLLDVIEHSRPATLMRVAGGLIGELRVMQRQQGSFAFGLDRDRDQRFPLGRRMPRPGEDQARIRHDLAIDACRFEIFAVILLEAEAVFSADAQVDLGLDRTGKRRTAA